MLRFYVKARETMNRLLKNQEGATMVEYAIMVALIAVVSIAIVTTLGLTVSDVFATVETKVDAVTP